MKRLHEEAIRLDAEQVAWEFDWLTEDQRSLLIQMVREASTAAYHMAEAYYTGSQRRLPRAEALLREAWGTIEDGARTRVKIEKFFEDTKK